MQQCGAAQHPGHGGLCGPGTAHPGRAEGAEQQRGNKRWRVQPEERHHQGAVGPQCGGIRQRTADRPADHPAQAGQRREPDGGPAAGQLRRGDPDPEPGCGHCAGSVLTHGGGRAGQRHHGGGGALCEESLGQAADGAGGGDLGTRGRAAGMAQARQPAG